jgi:hypothetical protein
MNTMIKLMAFAGASLLWTAAQAQDKAAPAAPVKPTQAKEAPAARTAVPPPIADGFRPINLGMMMKQLGLTPEQTEQAKELNAKYQKMHAALPADMPMMERTAKVKSMLQERDVALKALLTPAQATQYSEMRTPTGELVSPTAKPKPSMPKDQ